MKKGTTYNYEIAPVLTENRAERNAQLVTGTVVASSFGTATQMASEKAAALSTEHGKEYGVVRIW